MQLVKPRMLFAMGWVEAGSPVWQINEAPVVSFLVGLVGCGLTINVNWWRFESQFSELSGARSA